MNYDKYSNLSFESIDRIRHIQNNIFQNHMKYVFEHSHFYRKKLKNFNLKQITLDDISQLPLTSKNDLEDFYNDFLACQERQIADIVHTSGTSGKKIYFKYSEQDLQRLAYNEKISLLTAGLSADDIVLLTCTLDRCFIAGMAYYSGCRALGCSVIRNGASTFRSAMNLINELKPNLIIGVPSYIYKLAEFMQQENNDPALSSVVKLVCIGEPIRQWNCLDSKIFLEPNEICTQIESIWQAKAYSTYALTETVTTFCECEAARGGHLIPELCFIEIIDESGNQVPVGEEGEIVVTPFFTQAMPLIRYQTGDISRIIEEPCTCGRNSLRLGPITGRKFQMLKVKGTKIYPNSIYPILDSIKEILLYRLVAIRNNLSDSLIIELALNHNSENILEHITEILHSSLRIRLQLKIVEYSHLKNKVFPPGTRKPLKYIEKN